jgi:hypothetical protein
MLLLIANLAIPEDSLARLGFAKKLQKVGRQPAIEEWRVGMVCVCAEREREREISSSLREHRCWFCMD